MHSCSNLLSKSISPSDYDAKETKKKLLQLMKIVSAELDVSHAKLKKKAGLTSVIATTQRDGSSSAALLFWPI